MKFWRKINMNIEDAGKVARRAALAGMSAVFLAGATGCGNANVEKENQQKIQAEDTIKKSQEVRESIKEEKVRDVVRPTTAAKLEEQRKAAEEKAIREAEDAKKEQERLKAQEEEAKRVAEEQARQQAEEAKRVVEEQARIAQEQARIAQEQQANTQETQGNRGRATRDIGSGGVNNGAVDVVH